MKQGLAHEKSLLFQLIKCCFSSLTSEIAQNFINPVSGTEILELIGERIINCQDADSFLNKLKELRG